jgi:hypothetical protein
MTNVSDPPTTMESPSSDSAVLRRIIVPLVALMVCVATYALSVHMQRMIVFDEIGLQNPVYTFYTSGHMTYPLHGHPDFMVVHPPTHYAITAILMKLGLPLFAAAAVPVIALTAILAIVILTGPFSAVASVGLLLGYFVALTTWSEFYTLRPDLHVTAAWFAGLVTLESARLRGWSVGRLFLGSALAVLAAAVHYWGVSAILLPLIYSAVLIRQRGFDQSWRQLLAVAAGGCLIGLPFLIWFVIPLYRPIMQMVAAVQGDGTPLDAFTRHLASYEAFAQRLPAGWSIRTLSSALSSPALLLGVPAVFVAVPLLAWNRQTRTLAFAGALLPLFVLFLSQGKQVGYTGYFTPEFILMFAGLLITLLTVLQRTRPRIIGRTAWTTGLIVIMSTLAFRGVPTSMGTAWAWTPRLDALEVLRGAAERVIGSRAVVAVTSAGVWFTGGGTFVWNAFNEVADANQKGKDVRALLAPMDAVVLDTNWWNARKDLAPMGIWYAEGLLHLKGFVLPNGQVTRHMMQLFLSTTPSERVHGFFLEDDRAREFVEDPGGADVLAVLVCNRTPDLDEFAPAYYRFSFAYDRQPAQASPSIVLLGMSVSEALEHALAVTGCVTRDNRRGRLSDVSSADLRADAAEGPPVRFFTSAKAALMSASGASGQRTSAPR